MDMDQKNFAETLFDRAEQQIRLSNRGEGTASEYFELMVRGATTGLADAIVASFNGFKSETAPNEAELKQFNIDVEDKFFVTARVVQKLMGALVERLRRKAA
jgi:hypothetical protein